MNDMKKSETGRDEMSVAAKLPWQSPAIAVLPVAQTQNNGLVAPGDDIFSPSPTGS